MFGFGSVAAAPLERSREASARLRELMIVSLEYPGKHGSNAALRNGSVTRGSIPTQDATTVMKESLGHAVVSLALV